MRKGYAVAILTASVLASAPGQTDVQGSSVLRPGEKLSYSVRWTIFRLGTIVMTTGQSDGGSIPVTMEIRSNPDLPFVDIRDSLVSIVDSTEYWSHSLVEYCRGGKQPKETRTTRDSANRTVVYTVRSLRSGSLMQCDTLHDLGPYVEGPAIFMMARQLARSWQSRSIPTMVDGKPQTTDIVFKKEFDETEIDAVPYPIRTRKFEGIAHWKGAAAGMTGNFEGWVSDDAASIPVRAEVGIFLGSVVIQLERWERPGWVAPSSSHYAQGW